MRFQLPEDPNYKISIIYDDIKLATTSLLPRSVQSREIVHVNWTRYTVSDDV